MEVVNKKLVLVVIIIGIISGIFIWQNISDKETKLEMVSLNNETKSSNMFAIMLEEIDEEGNSTYVESSDNMWPSLKYKYNTTNSGCLDVNGTSITDILSYDSKNQKAIVRTKKVAYCYLYFDIDESVYAKVRNDYTDNNGALLLSETESDEYPVYYYSGDITNNNILYANFCWKMVRTTETGGVKLIYNGVPDEAEDGTLTCDNTGTESQIGTSIFNPNTSLAYVGYMYNDVYNILYKGAIDIAIFSRQYSPSTYYYYADTAIWNEETSQYVLSNSDGSEVSTYVWADNYNDLKGYYVCYNSTSCSDVIYIVGVSSSYFDYYELSNKKINNDYVLKFAKSITDNGDGTYTLNEPVKVLKKDWYTTYEKYKGYYYCSDLTSETCDVMYYAGSTSNRILYGYNVENIYKYGNSVIYEDGVYKLVNTIEFWNWPQNYNALNNNHYTCFNTTGECEKVNYIYYANSSTAYYITLSDGEFVEDAINKMLYAEDVNKTDSVMKATLDTWYENNIVDVLDSNNMLYSSYLEDTIWCNNRATTNLSTSGWNPNGGNIMTALKFNYKSLECENKTDQFTLKVAAGGTEGYGNNVLNYPIGLISSKEALLALSYGYLKSDNTYWLMGFREISNSSTGSYVHYSGAINAYASVNSSSSQAVRPSISLSNKVEILAGSGSVETPYQVILPN